MKRSTIFMIAGLLLLAAALGIVIYNKIDSDRAGRAAETTLEELSAVVEKNVTEQVTETPVQEVDIYESQGTMRTEKIGDYEYIGSVEFPTLDITVPVTEEWSYPRLKIAACRFSGSYYNNDLVICAHNYEHFFARIRWLPIGSEVRFVTVNGKVFKYIVSNRESVSPTTFYDAVGSAEDWDLTLFTCDPGGKTRCLVRCERVE